MLWSGSKSARAAVSAAGSEESVLNERADTRRRRTRARRRPRPRAHPLAHASAARAPRRRARPLDAMSAMEVEEPKPVPHDLDHDHKPWWQGPHLDEKTGLPLPVEEVHPVARAPKVENPLLDEDEMDHFVRDGMKTYEELKKIPLEERTKYKHGMPVTEKDWLMRLTYGGASVDEETLEAIRGMDFLKDRLPSEVKDQVSPEVEAHFAEQRRKHWQQCCDDIDERMKAWDLLEQDHARIRREREGIETPFPEGGSWDWEVYRRERFYENERHREAKEKAEAAGEPAPEPEPAVASPILPEDFLAEELKSGAVTEDQVESERDLAKRCARLDTMAIILDIEAAAHAAAEAGKVAGKDLPFPFSGRAMPDDFPRDASFPYDPTGQRPAGYYSDDELDASPDGPPDGTPDGDGAPEPKPDFMGASAGAITRAVDTTIAELERAREPDADDAKKPSTKRKK